MGGGVECGSVVILYQHFGGRGRRIMSWRSAWATQPDQVSKMKREQMDSGDGVGSGEPLKKGTKPNKNSRRNSGLPFHNIIVPIKAYLVICIY